MTSLPPDDSGFSTGPVYLTTDEKPQLLYESVTGYTRIYTITHNGRRLVAKGLKPAYQGSTLHRELLEKEFIIASGIYHPGVVTVIGFENFDKAGPAIIMEYIDGMTLDKYLDREAALPEKEIAGIAMQVCDALEYIHSRQIIHRDLKPTNIMITADGRYVKIIDFGLSDSPSYISLKYSGGTPRYGAPEQFEGAADCRADIYAFGKIFEGFLKGRRYRKIISQCTLTNREKRPSSVHVVKEMLRKAGHSASMLFWISGLVGLLLSIAIGYMIGNHKDIVTQSTSVAEIQAALNSEALLQQSIDSLMKYSREYTFTVLEEAYSGGTAPDSLDLVPNQILTTIDEMTEREFPDEEICARVRGQIREASASAMREFHASHEWL